MNAVETARLLLRRWSPDDLDDLVRIFAKPEVWRYPLQRGFTADETGDWLRRQIDGWATRGWGLWAALTREQPTVIGYVGLSTPEFLPEVMPAVEVGWRLDPDHWGRGFATEGARAALDFGFRTLGLDEIISIYEPDNVASGRVMQRLGMVCDRDTTHPTLGMPLRVFRIRKGAA